MVQHHIYLAQTFWILAFGDESLHEDSVNSVLFHPFEMPQDGLAIERAENFRRRAIGMLERRDVALVRVEFAHIGPKINLAASRLKPIAPAPMKPVTSRAIAFADEPSLIPAHHLACECLRIDAGMARSFVRSHCALDNRSAVHRVWIAPFCNCARLGRLQRRDIRCVNPNCFQKKPQQDKTINAFHLTEICRSSATVSGPGCCSSRA